MPKKKNELELALLAEYPRDASPCPGFERCGSCEWSHVPYEVQRTYKAQQLSTLLTVASGEEFSVEVTPSPTTAHYRNRMDFPIDFEGRVGLREKGKWWRVIDDHHCFISDTKIEKIFSEVRQWSRDSGLTYFDRKKHHGFLRYAVIRTTSLGQSLLTLVTSDPAGDSCEAKIEGALATLVSATSADEIVWAINHTVSDVSFGDELRVLKGKGALQERMLGVEYQITPNAFFQTNFHIAPLLLECVLSMCGDLTGVRLLDLFCGTGFFALACAKRGADVVGVELVADAVRDARYNAEVNNLPVTFHDLLAEKFQWRELKPEVVIIDPPRSGVHPTLLQELCDAGEIKRLIYISCNPPQFGRDFVTLRQSYRIVKAQGFDMFPHTPHVELVVLLERTL